MNYEVLIIFAASFLTGVTASMGMGGGFILLLYLTIFAGVQQFQAQGINLLFFIPIAVFSLVFHVKNKLVETKPLLPALLSGAVGVGIGVFLSGIIPEKIVAKLFAILILIVGVKELLHKKE